MFPFCRVRLSFLLLKLFHPDFDKDQWTPQFLIMMLFLLLSYYLFVFSQCLHIILSQLCFELTVFEAGLLSSFFSDMFAVLVVPVFLFQSLFRCRAVLSKTCFTGWFMINIM